MITAVSSASAPAWCATPSPVGTVSSSVDTPSANYGIAEMTAGGTGVLTFPTSVLVSSAPRAITTRDASGTSDTDDSDAAADGTIAEVEHWKVAVHHTLSVSGRPDSNGARHERVEQVV